MRENEDYKYVHTGSNTGISAYGDGNENLVYNKKIHFLNKHLINWNILVEVSVDTLTQAKRKPLQTGVK